MPKRRAIVVGAGPGGLAAAIVLQRSGFDVTVCERARYAGAGGSGLTLWPNATSALDMLSLLPALGRISQPLTRIAMKNSSGRTLFDDELARVNGDGRFPALVLLRADLVDLLAGQLPGAIATNAPVTGLRQDRDTVTALLADGRQLDADILIGADGLHSVVREQLVRDPLVFAGYTVWRGIAPVRPSEASGTVWMGRGRQFGLFPLPGGRAYWFASQRTARSRRHVPADERADVAAAFSEWPHPIPHEVQSTDPALILRTDIHGRRPLKRWAFGRAALLGDAAHPAEPTLGQGACQAIEDAVMLGACVAGADDVVAALHQYEARRIRRANSFVLEARRMGKLGLWEGAWACWLRDRMMGAMPAAMREKQLARMFAFGV